MLTLVANKRITTISYLVDTLYVHTLELETHDQGMGSVLMSRSSSAGRLVYRTVKHRIAAIVLVKCGN